MTKKRAIFTTNELAANLAAALKAPITVRVTGLADGDRCFKTMGDYRQWLKNGQP